MGRGKPKRQSGGWGERSEYTPERGEEICNYIIDGLTLRALCEKMDISTSVVLKWLHKHEGFNKQYYLARQLQMELIIDGILSISDDGSEDWITDDEGRERVDHEHIARSRLKIDTRKWLAAKIYPKMYGDKIQVDAGPGTTTATLVIKHEQPDGDKD